MEVDTVFSIANPFAFYYINKDFIEDDSVFTGLEKRILEVALEKAEQPRSTSRYDKFLQYEKKLFESDLAELRGKYIIPMTAFAVIDPTSGQKSVICPFSNQNMVTGKMLQLLERNIPLEFLQKFVFWPISPIDFMFCYGEKEGVPGIIHPLEKIVDSVNLNAKGIGYGALFKSEEFAPKKGNFNIYAGILEPAFPINRYDRHPESFHQTLLELGCRTAKDFREYRSAVSSFCKKILAQKYIKLFDKLDLIKTMYEDFKIPELMYFGEKTSYGADVLEKIKKRSKDKYLYSFIGTGPLSNVKDITKLGVAHDSAISLLFGFIIKQYEVKTGKSVKRPERRIVPAWESRGSEDGFIQYRPCPERSWFLCELDRCRHPCAMDCVDKLMDEKKLTQKIIKYIDKQMDRKRDGFSRIEARLAQLANQDALVYVGDRRQSKLNSSWQNIELAGKRIEFLDLSSFVDKDDAVGDLRGSEFTMPCDAARLFTKLDRKIKQKIISEELFMHPELSKNFFKTNDSKTYDGIAAIVGTAVHSITSLPMDGLVHYETLERGGLDAVPSDFYTELAFRHRHLVKETGEEISITFHPDCQFFLKRKDGLDIVIMDHKTNRWITYPYVKYKNQGKIYAYCLKKITGLNFINTYLIFNHMAFDNAFGLDFKNPKGYTGSEYLHRQQRYIAPTVYYPEHTAVIDEAIEKEIDRTYLVQKKIKQCPAEFLQERSEEKCVQQCFQDQKMICDYFARKAADGLSYLDAIEELKE